MCIQSILEKNAITHLRCECEKRISYLDFEYVFLQYCLCLTNELIKIIMIMIKKITLILTILLCLFYIEGNAQTQFWSDTFEDAGAPSTGSRTTSLAEFSCNSPATSYFFKTTLPGIVLQSGIYSKLEATNFFAAEDIERGPKCTDALIAGTNTTLDIRFNCRVNATASQKIAVDNLF